MSDAHDIYFIKYTVEGRCILFIRNKNVKYTMYYYGLIKNYIPHKPTHCLLLSISYFLNHRCIY